MQRLLQEGLLDLLVQVAHVNCVVDHPNIPHGYIRAPEHCFWCCWCCCCCPQRQKISSCPLRWGLVPLLRREIPANRIRSRRTPWASALTTRGYRSAWLKIESLFLVDTRAKQSLRFAIALDLSNEGFNVLRGRSQYGVRGCMVRHGSGPVFFVVFPVPPGSSSWYAQRSSFVDKV